MGWQKIPKIFCAYSCSLFVALVGILIASSVRGGFYGSTVFFRGKCSKAEGINLGTHIAITVFAAGVTVSSDRFLNLVLAAQPEDIHKAHTNRRWIEIGVNSWRNLGFAARWRRFCWALLLISSVPLQLLSNAAVFRTYTNTDFQQITVSQSFLEDGPWQIPGIASLEFGEGWISYNQSYHDMVERFQQYSQGSNWTKLDSVQCQKTYLDATNGLQEYRNLIIVIEAGPDPNAKGWTGSEVWNNSMPMYYANLSMDTYDPNAVNTLWSLDSLCETYGNENICSGGLGQYDSLLDEPVTSNLSGPWQWEYVEATFGFPADVGNFSQAYNNITGLFCLAEPFTTPCKVEVTNGFLLAVCICLFIKSGVSIFILYRTRNTQPILCLGDMIQLGLQREEANSNTTGLCTYNQDWFRRAKPVRDAEATDDMRPRWVSQPRKWASTPKRWRNAVPRRVWWATYISISLVLLVVLIILGIAFEDYSGATGGLHDTGFGDNPHNFQIHLFNNRASGAIVANLPQSILTGCYFWFTALYVRMFQARDWANFAVEGYLQRIMVTEPTEPDQKDSYWLGIPLAWGLLFLACSIALHWTTGQSIYQIASEDLASGADDILASPLQFDISFSVEAIWVTLGLAVLTVAIPVALSFRTLPENSIIVGTNSAAISAQCHEARRQPDVQKEQVSEAQSRSEGHTAISLTNDEIQPVIEREDGIEMLQINTSPDRPQNGSNNAIEAEDDRELRGVASREIEPPSNGNDIATPQGESLANVPNENDASPPDESGQTIPQENPQSAPNDPTATNSVPKPPWLQLLQWGVLVEGSTDRNNPGQLGLAPIKNIISKPKDGHFYE